MRGIGSGVCLAQAALYRPETIKKKKRAYVVASCRHLQRRQTVHISPPLHHSKRCRGRWYPSTSAHRVTDDGGKDCTPLNLRNLLSCLWGSSKHRGAFVDNKGALDRHCGSELDTQPESRQFRVLRFEFSWFSSLWGQGLVRGIENEDSG